MNNYNFFIGAGASAALGFPLMTNLAENFVERIKNNPDLFKTYDTILNQMKIVFKDDEPDVESIMSVIVNLKDEKNYKENMGDFALFVLSLFTSYDNIQSKLDEFKQNLEDLEKEYKQYIISQMELDTKKIDECYKVYDNLFGSLYKLSVSGVQEVTPYSKLDLKSKEMHKQFNIFTTNYDTLIEKYFYCNVNDPDIYTGAEHDHSSYKVMNANVFVNNCLGNHRPFRMNLIKLHGSVNWYKNNRDEIIEDSPSVTLDEIKERNESCHVKEEVLIYPLNQKVLYISPFIQFFHFLEKELKSDKIWIVIGYSFRDIIIRNMFEKSIDKIKYILLVTPKSSKVKELFDKKVREKIIEIKGDFGSNDYESMNKKIIDELKSLS